MKTKILLLLAGIIFTNTYAQFGAQQIITTNALGTWSVYASDLDGDGDMDVLSASLYDNKIAWYENTNGQGSFGSQQIITTNADGAISVYASDLDGDGDMDVLSASINDNKIAWYENTDGQGSFGSQQLITTNIDGAISVYASDLDGDGDMDVLSASLNDDKIAWYENTNGQGSFGLQQLITPTTNTDGAMSVYTSDLDGDGDMDVLSASNYDNKVSWYENTNGQGGFGSQQIITTNTLGVTSVYACDLDGDLDMDVLSASFSDNKISWYENTDGQGSFGSQQIITTNTLEATSVYACDLDGDGDMDVLSSSLNDDKIAWYENTDGQGDFGSQQIITTNTDGAESVYATDIDGDGDMDVLSASNYDNKIAWYENLHPLSINENEIVDISVFPIPVKDVLNILNQNDNPISSIQIYDILGRLVLEGKDDFNQLDVSNLYSGVLFVKIQTTEGVVAKKIIKE